MEQKKINILSPTFSNPTDNSTCSFTEIEMKNYYNVGYLTLYAQMDSSYFSLSIADPDEMPHYAIFHLGLHCLPKYPFRSNQYTKGYRKKVPNTL